MCDKQGLTPMLAAVLHGNLEVVEFLYKFRDGYVGKFPLKAVHIASGLKDHYILEWLSNQGEDLWQVDNSVLVI